MYSLPKIQHSKSIRMKNNKSGERLKLKLKEQHWDNRFHIDHMDQFRQNARLNLLEKLAWYNESLFSLDPRIKMSERVELAGKRHLRSQRTTIRNRSVSSADQKTHQPTVIQMKMQLKRLWEENQIPDCHRSYYLHVLECCKVKRCKKYIEQEVTRISKKKCSIYNVMRSVNARENCIERIREAVKDTSVSVVDNHALLKDYVDLTVYCIQNIVNWRLDMDKWLKRDKVQKHHVSYRHSGKNYLFKILQDGKQLSEWLHVHPNDPLLLQLELGVPSKSRACQIILLEEAVQGNL